MILFDWHLSGKGINASSEALEVASAPGERKKLVNLVWEKFKLQIQKQTERLNLFLSLV